MLIEFFTKHNKLLIVMVILAIFGIWRVGVNLLQILIQLQYCDIFSSEGTTSATFMICYILGQG